MKKNAGFSLVELIIVIAIMAILAGALAPALIKYIQKSRKSTDESNASTIQTCVSNALSDEDALSTFLSKTSTGEYAGTLATLTTSDYLGTELSDQLGSSSLTSKYYAKGSSFCVNISVANNTIDVIAGDTIVVGNNK